MQSLKFKRHRRSHHRKCCKDFTFPFKMADTKTLYNINKKKIDRFTLLALISVYEAALAKEVYIPSFNILYCPKYCRLR